MSTLNEDDRENLAAYLDGELDELTAQALEAKLNQDPDARKEVDVLRRTWSMLDILPRPEPSPNFTNRTMERLTLAVPRAAPTAKMAPLRPGRWLLTLAWAGAVLIGLTLGAVAGSLLWREKDDPLAEVIAQHGGVIHHFLLYEPIIDLEFLKSLDQPELFGDEFLTDDQERGRPTKQSGAHATIPEGEPAVSPAPTVRQQRACAAAFLALPAERREQLVRLDRDLESSNIRDRLHGVAHRYREWLDHLEAKERDRVMNDSDRNGRLAIIKDIRDQQWLASQPKAHRLLWESLQGQARADLMKKLHEEDLQHRWAWRVQVRKEHLDKDVQEYYDQYLKYMLSAEEKDRLSKAEGQSPRFLQTLVELADRHPPALPGPNGPRTLAQLPNEVKDRLNLNLKKPGKVIKGKEGWPLLAVSVAEMAFKKNVILPNELWPTSDKGLNPPMKAFLKKLSPLLSMQEKVKLTDAAGKWPEYPETIQELASAHNLHPPWFTLPGPRDRWEMYRIQKADDGPR
jgi:hypothetical protein